MSVQNSPPLAEALRTYLSMNAPLPVDDAAFNIDAFLLQGDSMSLQMTEGKNSKTYIDGSKKISQPFTIYYRRPSTITNSDKAAMLDALNAVGAWMQKSGMPALGAGIAASTFEQVLTARTNEEQMENFITYQAGYVLGYITK